MSRLFAMGRRTFSALSVPNYRRFFFGQSVSLVGTWMQTVAQSWLVYSLTRSATAIGLVVALQTLPVLVLGAYGGVIADRADKRRLMIVLQSLMGLQALVLGLLAVTHVVRFWELCVLAVVLGLNNTFENPARQSFVLEMVGAAELRNAVSLNSTMVNVAPRDRAGGRRAPDRERWRERVFPDQCRELRGRGLLARLDGHWRAKPDRADGS